MCRITRLALIFALAGLTLPSTLTACGPAEDEVGTVGVRAVDDEFSASTVRIPVGGTVSWGVGGNNPHNVTAADRSWASAETLLRGDAYARTFDEPGAHPYFCTFHGTADGAGMAGWVLVGDDAELPPAAQPPPAVAEPSGTTIRVPDDHPTIQDAVDAAAPGDLILVAPGVYRESVQVRTPSLVIRGLDRNTAILEGDFERVHGIQVVGADGVTIENLTARNYTLNGFYWTDVTGYRGSYLTAHNLGDYGIYAFAAVDGLLEHSYASGALDAGFYIGQCYPCRAVIREVVAERNGLGYSGTNAGGDLYIVDSVWRDNMAGIVPNSLDSELDPPARENVIAGNLVIGNSNPDAPAGEAEYSGFGNGIILAGTVGDRVERNLVLNHDRYGILVTSNLDERWYFASRSEVRDNVVGGSGIADLALAGPAGEGNCFEGNLVDTSAPPGLHAFYGCEGLRLPLGSELSATLGSLAYVIEAGAGDFPHGDWHTTPAPPPQPNMPDAATAPGRPAVDVFDPPDLADIEVPVLSDPVDVRSQEVLVTGVPVSQPGFWQLIMGLWGYLLPVLLLASWVALAMWDLARREDLSRPATIGWMAAILAVPFLGVIAYHLAGRSLIPGWMRGALVGGGVAIWVLVLAVGALVGGVI